MSAVFCTHASQDLRRRIDAAARPFYQYQCLNCGDRVGTAVAATIALAYGQLEPFDEAFREKGEREADKFYREQAAARARKDHTLFTARRLKDRQDYEAYLQTDAWRAKRTQALIRDHGVCQGCFIGRATEVNHLTYAHLGDELLFELISVCDECHTRIHSDKQAASTGAAGDARPAYDSDGNALNYDEEEET